MNIDEGSDMKFVVVANDNPSDEWYVNKVINFIKKL